MHVNHSWQNLLKNSFTTLEALLSYVELSWDEVTVSKIAEKDFSVRITKSYADKIEKKNPRDPLLLQILPLKAEEEKYEDYQKDPLAEKHYNPIKGLIHKYPHRVLITLVGECAIHCRYCFRRHFPYNDNNPGREGWNTILDYIEKNPQISEVIFSGGDPLLAKDNVLEERINSLAAIPHLKRLRIHSRIPLVLPERITPEFIRVFTQTRLQPILVLHCNHPKELDNTIAAAMTSLREANVTLLNQTVLLKGVNDNALILKDLSEDLFAMNILPYYLHLLDKVEGAAHFDISFEKAKEIQTDLLRSLPGYLVPKLVREVPGILHKVGV